MDLINEHEVRRLESINLVASENLMSAEARAAMQSDLNNRYCMPAELPENMWDYPNQTYLRKIRALVELYACNIFSGKYADSRPLSGNNVAYIILKALVPAGGNAFSVPGPCGGHFTTPIIAARDKFDLHDLPFDSETGCIDVQRVKELSEKVKPDLVFLDSSMQLFPHPVKELRQILGEDVVISYDASHTLGLIGGGVFQAPLKEGADLVHGSTHKSLFGPQKGLIVCKNDVAHPDRIAHRIKEIITPLFVSNMHIHNIAALGVALEEVSAFGSSYARQVVKNAKTFGQALNDEGIDVLYAQKDFTESHQVMCKIGTSEQMQALLKKLEEANIHVNGVKVPHRESYGFRFGLSELTRRGLKENDIKWIAKAVANCVFSRVPNDLIAGEVRDFSRTFDGVSYVF